MKNRKNLQNREKKNMFSLGEKDRKILTVLSENARASIADISKKTGIKRDSVAYRLEKMVSGKIVDFSLDINYKKLGFEVVAVISIGLENFNVEKEKQLAEFLEKSNRVRDYSLLSGKNDYMAKILARNHDEMNLLIREMRTRFSGMIKEIQIENVIEERKKTLLP